jgi:hypothetical protein
MKTNKKNKFNTENEMEGFFENSSQVSLHKELFLDYSSNIRVFFSSNSDNIDFRFVEYSKRSEPYLLTVVNNSNERMFVKWIYDNLNPTKNDNKEKIPNSKIEKFNKEKLEKKIKDKNSVQNYLGGGRNSNHDNSVYSVFPDEVIIPKKSSLDFKIYFTPSKQEFYFFTELVCLGFVIPNKLMAENSIDLSSNNNNSNIRIIKELIGNSSILLSKNQNTNKSKLDSLTMGTDRISLKKIDGNSNNIINKIIDPPIPLKISVVGHSFPPNTQIFIPMAEVEPKNDLFFAHTSVNQSQYTTFKIKNTTDTPLYFKFISDTSHTFRVFPKLGLVEPKSFYLIAAEFCPKVPKIYKFPLKIVFNHDNTNMYTLNLNGVCEDPEIEINEGKKEVYFSPSFVNISTKKTVNIVNTSAIKVNAVINILYVKQLKKKKNSNNKDLKNSTTMLEMSKIDMNDELLLKNNEAKFNFSKNFNTSMTKKMSKDLNMNNVSNLELEQSKYNEIDEEEEDYINPASIIIEPNYFDLEGFQNKTIDFILTPLEKCFFKFTVEIIATRIFDPSLDNIGIFNPYNNINFTMNNPDKRQFSRRINIVGSGSDGNLKIDPPVLDFGTVKVGFQDKKQFSIQNTSFCNFYIKLQFDTNFDSNCFKIDFTEGLIYSLCKKTITISYKPDTRKNLDFNIMILATENNSNKLVKTEGAIVQRNHTTSISNNLIEEKACIKIKANGNYPFIKIVDVRNNFKSTTNLWKSFSCNEANVELGKELTEAEIDFINSEKANKNIFDFYDKLKCVRFDFGKHLLKKNDKSNNIQKFVVYLTFKNEGGVDSEFFFKFPDDINIKREIWMDPDEPTSEGTKEYHVLKYKIFDIEPRKFKLKKNECCNIKFTYNIQEKADHSLRVIFQIVNGKPLIFELFGETHYEKEGILAINNTEVNFYTVPIGNMLPMTTLVELQNVGGIKLKYILDESVIDEFNSQFDGFPIFKIDNSEGSLGSGDVRHIVVNFKPLTAMNYHLTVPVDYYDDINLTHKKMYLEFSGTGYLKLEKNLNINEDHDNLGENEDREEGFDFLKEIAKLPKNIIYNNFDNKIIYKCGLSIDELNFGIVEEGKQSAQTFILYNYSNTDPLEYEIKNNGFSNKDDIKFIPDSGKLEPNSHIIIKSILTSRTKMLTYIGEAQVMITWKKEEFKDNFNSQIYVEKQQLHIRCIKRSLIRDINTFEGKLEYSLPDNVCFVENVLTEIFKDILSNKEFDEHLSNTIDNQPLRLYQWTTNGTVSNQANLRKSLIENNIERAKKNDFNYNNISYKKPNKQKDKQGGNLVNEPIQQEAEDLEKNYTEELVKKFDYSNSEMEEKMLMVNDDTKKLVFDILENTIYNIICEAVYGETDLSEPTKIFFIKK